MLKHALSTQGKAFDRDKIARRLTKRFLDTCGNSARIYLVWRSGSPLWPSDFVCHVPPKEHRQLQSSYIFETQLTVCLWLIRNLTVRGDEGSLVGTTSGSSQKRSSRTTRVRGRESFKTVNLLAILQEIPMAIQYALLVNLPLYVALARTERDAGCAEHNFH